jgi:hypothetical protein
MAGNKAEYQETTYISIIMIVPCVSPVPCRGSQEISKYDCNASNTGWDYSRCEIKLDLGEK